MKKDEVWRDIFFFLIQLLNFVSYSFDKNSLGLSNCPPSYFQFCLSETVQACACERFLNFLVVLISYKDQVLHILLWSQIHLFVVNCSFQETKRYDITITKGIQLRLSIYYDQSSDYTQKQLSRDVLKKRSSENRLQISKCDFSKVAKQLYWNHTSVWL